MELKDKPPEDPKEEVASLEGAIKKTKESIEEHKANGWDSSEFKVHLKGLESSLEKAKKKIQ